MPLRLFAALDPADASRARLAAVSKELRDAPGVRWVTPEALHVTLRFFGECPAARLEELTDALSKVEPPAAPVEVNLSRLAFLPNERSPRLVIAVGETPEPLAEFQHRIERAARDLGFEPEKRAFLLHVTLGRIRDPRQGRQAVDAAHAYSESLGSFSVNHWTLYASETRPDGAVYRSLRRWTWS